MISAITVDLPNQHPTVVLRESESPRRQLSFSVSLQDGIVLSHAMRRIPTPRPLTHELLSEVLSGFDVDVVAVRIVGRRGAVYFAELDLQGRSGRSVHSCRPSDALAVALVRPVPVPILIDARLFEETGDITPPGSVPPPS
ncbi:MAG: bifunctional nuclease family protein [Acidimicrobiales bacterium]